MDKELLPYLQELTAVSTTVFLAYFLWWKSKLREELVDPEIDLLNKDIERVNARLAKIECRQDRQENLIDEKMSKINDKLTEIHELIANQNGKIEVMLEREKRSKEN